MFASYSLLFLDGTLYEHPWTTSCVEVSRTLGTATGITKCDCDMQLRWTLGVEPSTNSQWIAHHPKFGWTSSKMDNTSLNPQPILSHLMFGETWSISIETYGDHWMRPVIVILFFGKLPKISFASQVTWLSHTSMAETSSRIHPTWRQNRAAQLAKDNHSQPGSLRKSVASPSSSLSIHWKRWFLKLWQVNWNWYPANHSGILI